MLTLEQSAEKWPFSAEGGASDCFTPLGPQHGQVVGDPAWDICQWQRSFVDFIVACKVLLCDAGYWQHKQVSYIQLSDCCTVGWHRHTWTRRSWTRKPKSFMQTWHTLPSRRPSGWNLLKTSTRHWRSVVSCCSEWRPYSLCTVPSRHLAYLLYAVCKALDPVTFWLCVLDQHRRTSLRACTGHLTSTLVVVCALLTQPCWWYRPPDAQHSVTVPSHWLRHVRGTACCRLSGMHRRWWRSVASWRLYFSGRHLTMIRRSWLYCTV